MIEMNVEKHHTEDRRQMLGCITIEIQYSMQNKTHTCTTQQALVLLG
jgi:hypothetical protein